MPDEARCTCPPSDGTALETRLPCVLHPERERRTEELLASVEFLPRLDITPDFVRNVR